jgi:nucleoside-diphosphate-sugar epimerase
MKIAIFGATSQIAKDLVCSFAVQSIHELVLYARRPEAVTQWLVSVDLAHRYPVRDFDALDKDADLNAILNFVGVGNPVQAAAMGASIFDVTLQYDELALRYVRRHPSCRYIFLSSGAAYGSNFGAPVNATTKAVIPINSLQSHDWYAVAKLHAECRHRSLTHLPIVDIRIFNYFCHTQDMDACFLITDIVRAIRDKTVLETSVDYIVRDFVGPDDFYQLINVMITTPAINVAIDCYSKAPIDKPALLATMQANFGLQYKMTESATRVNATGSKSHYYSVNRRAGDFGYLPRYSTVECLLIEIKLSMLGYLVIDL